MKVNLQTLQKNVFSVECEPDDTVLQLKEKIQAAQNVPPEQQNLVFNGKVLNDSTLLSAAGVKDGAKLIFFPKKPSASGAATTRPAPTTTTTPSTPSKTEEKQTPPAQTPATQETKPPTETPANQSTQPATQPAAPSQPERAGLPEVDESKISQLMNMGFQRSQVEQALKAADGNVQIAVEFLMSGMPLDSIGGRRGQDRSSRPAAAHPYLDELRTHPQLNQIRQLLSAHPEAIQQVIGPIAQNCPQLAQEIQANPQEFASVLAGLPSTDGLPHAGGGDDDDDDDDEDNDNPTEDPLQRVLRASAAEQAPVVADLTAEDNANIAQIMTVTGASKAACTEAYIACGKNVEYAINFLFDS